MNDEKTTDEKSPVAMDVDDAAARAKMLGCGWDERTVNLLLRPERIGGKMTKFRGPVHVGTYGMPVVPLMLNLIEGKLA